MNEHIQRPSSKNKLLWTLLAVLVVGAVSVTVVAVVLLKKSGVTASLPGFGGGITPIDLTAFYDKSGSWDRGNEFMEVPRGAAVIGNVPFEVNGLLRLSGRTAKNDNKTYRDEVKGIPVGKKFARLHVLHIISSSTSDGTPYARITLRYADGSMTSFPMIYGHHGRNWHRPKYEFPSALNDPNTTVVWRGEYDSTPVDGKTLRIFKSMFTNPKPDLAVTSIDLASENASPNATIMAMSVGPAHLPKVNPPSLPEPEVPYEGEMKITAVETESGKPVEKVRVKISGSESGGSFQAPEVITDAKGQATVPHPGGSTRTLTLIASGDGVAMKTFRWRTADGDVVPPEFTMQLEKGIAIGGVVHDETGAPVAKAKVVLRRMGNPREPAPRDTMPFSETVETDAQGQWEFRSLPQKLASLSMAVSHPDYVDSQFMSDAVDRAYVGDRIKFSALTDKSAVFRLRKGLNVTGRVLNEAGKPISGAKLLLGNSRFESRPNTARTDDKGAFRLPGARAGTTYLTVQANGYAPQMRQVTVDAKTEPVEFKLEPGRVIKMKVVDEFDTPVRTARVTIDMWQNRQTIDLGGTTDSRGQLTIDSAPADGMSGSIYKAGFMSMGGIQFQADGADRTFTLRRSITISADIVDAETKEPIPRFDVTRGQSQGYGDQVYWQTYNIIRGSNGVLSLRLDQQNITALKVEADDHLPAIVPLSTNGETHLKIELKKGSGPKGIVLQPDGAPAARAQLVVLAPNRPINIGLNRLANGSRGDGASAESDAKGAFLLRPEPEAERILVLHPSGYAEASYSNFVNGSTIKLEAWGVVEGVVTVGGKPGTNESVMLTPGQVTARGNYWYDFSEYRVTTDSAGKFVISNAPPGERRLVRLVQTDQNSWQHTQPTDVLVKAGEVARMDIGGNGHRLIGQLALSDPSVPIKWRGGFTHSLSSYPKPPPFTSQEQYREWAALPETIEAQKKARSYMIQLSETGSFQIEDVLPGKYDLNFAFNESDPGERPYGRTIASLNTNIVVPPFVKSATPPPPIDLGQLIVPLRPDYRKTSGAPAPRAANDRF